MELIISTVLLGIAAFFFLKKIKSLYTRIEELEKKSKDDGDIKKSKDDIKTLYQNQQMLLSLVNALRIRINNFYAKKIKEPKFKSAGFDNVKEFGES